MMIKIKFFARMRDEFGRADDTMAFTPGLTVADVWQAMAAGNTLPEGVLVAVNMEHVKDNPELSDGDEVAFFPAVTGG